MDTSALMAPVETGVRLFEELERLLATPDVVVPEAVLEELTSLAGETGESGRAASVGLDLAGRFERIETNASYADDALVELATADRVDGVVTNDRNLKERVLAAGTPVIHLRGRTQLECTKPCTSE